MRALLPLLRLSDLSAALLGERRPQEGAHWSRAAKEIAVIATRGVEYVEAREHFRLASDETVKTIVVYGPVMQTSTAT